VGGEGSVSVGRAWGPYGSVRIKGRSKHYDITVEYPFPKKDKAGRELTKKRKAAMIEAISNACSLH
jgi:hypothetical protein